MARRGIEAVELWLTESRPCREVYGGDCNIHVSPPRPGPAGGRGGRALPQG